MRTPTVTTTDVPRRSAVVALVATLLTAIQLVTAVPASAVTADPRTAAEATAEALVAQLHNDARANPGAFGYASSPSAPAMTVWTDIREVSRVWSDRMAASESMSHNPHYADQYCCWTQVGENVAWSSMRDLQAATVEDTARRLFQMWMDSTGHRENILRPAYDHFAVGITIAEHSRYGYALWATANFRRWDGSAISGQPVGGLVAPAERVTDRLSGGDYVGTSVTVARRTFDTAPTVLLATADAYPDALAAASLAGVHDAPLLLTPSRTLDDRVADAIVALGAREVVILGGDVAVSDAVERAVRTRTGATPRRVQGGDRFSTAIAVSREVARRTGDVRRVFVVEGANADPNRGWPDAMSASAIAARTNAPILLVSSGDAPDATLAALRDLDVDEVVVVGGGVAVSDAVARELATVAPKVTRWWGVDRYDTSAQAVARSGLSAQSVYAASGTNFRDALVGGPAAAHDGSVMLLVSDGSETVFDHVRDRHRGKHGYVIGPVDRLSETARGKLDRALAG